MNLFLDEYLPLFLFINIGVIILTFESFVKFILLLSINYLLMNQNKKLNIISLNNDRYYYNN